MKAITKIISRIIIVSMLFCMINSSLNASRRVYRAIVDQDVCISCGTCISIAPEVFSWSGNVNAAQGGEVPLGALGLAYEAVGACPVSAIFINY